MDDSRELSPVSKGLYQVQAAIDAVLQCLRDSVVVIVSSGRVKKVSNGPRASRPAISTSIEPLP